MKTLILCAAVFLCSANLVWCRTHVVKLTYEYAEHQKRLREILQETQKLKIKWLRLTTPHQIEKFAKAHDLHAPKIHQIFKYERSNESVEKRSVQ